MLRKIGLAVAVAAAMMLSPMAYAGHGHGGHGHGGHGHGHGHGHTVMDMDTAMATLIGTMVTGTTGMGTVMADGGAATGMATVSVHAGAGHPADTSGFATSRDLLISGNSGRRFRTGVLLFQGGSGVA